LHFNEGSGTIAYDSSGNNNHGTLYSGSTICSNPPTSGCPTWVDGKFGKALSFDGVNDYVISSIGISPPSTFTANIWIYYTGDNGVVVDWLGQAGINTGYHDSGIEIVGGTVRVRYWNLPCVNLGSITANNWYMITLVYDGTNLKGYINGVFKASTSGALSHPSTLYIALGAADSTNCGDGTYFAGIVDEFRFYNRALSDAEIQALYQAKARLDYGDIRFTDSDGSTLLNYWQESDGRFWVKVPSIPASSTKTIYVYYGNPSATSASSVQNTLIANSIYAMSGSCTDATNCGYMDNHAEADAIRGYAANICTKYVDKIYWGSVCDNSNPGSSVRDYFYSRFRFLFVPDVSGTWYFAVDSDDGSEIVKSNADMYGGIHEHTVIATWYGGHGWCNCQSRNGPISLVAGQGIWLDYIQEEWAGAEAAVVWVLKPGGTWVNLNTANFPNQIFARKYTSPEPTTSVGAEEVLSASNFIYTQSPAVSSNPSATYTCPSCQYSSNTYYGVAYSVNESVWTAFTAAQTFTCKMEASQSGSCSCTSNTQCYNPCNVNWGSYYDGYCYNSKCYDAIPGSTFGLTQSCLAGTVLNHETSSGRYANVNGRLYYCKGSDNSVSPYPFVFNLSPGSSVGNCKCNQDGSWSCQAGTIPIRGGRIKIV
jgi:hypothetical protein